MPGLLIAYGRFTATVQGQAGDIVYSGEGLHSSVAVSRLPNGRLGYHNAGKIQASSEPQDMRLQRMLGHLTTLVPSHARSVLVIGCGAGVTAGAVSIDPLVERVTIAEIEPLVPRVVSKYFGAENHHVIDNPKVRVQIDDARHFLLTSKEKFDAITSDPLDPWVKGAATLYTKEFFEAAKAHLNPGGVVTLFVQLYESTPEAVKSEMATFFTVFPERHHRRQHVPGSGLRHRAARARPVRRASMSTRSTARLSDPAYAPVAQSLRDVGVRSAVDLLASYAGRAVDLQPWLRDAAINHDGDLRLQYLAGLGLNANEGDRVYAEILKYRRYPDDLFVGSEDTLAALRSRISTDTFVHIVCPRSAISIRPTRTSARLVRACHAEFYRWPNRDPNRRPSDADTAARRPRTALRVSHASCPCGLQSLRSAALIPPTIELGVTDSRFATPMFVLVESRLPDASLDDQVK